jgi:hypothetical protein
MLLCGGSHWTLKIGRGFFGDERFRSENGFLTFAMLILRYMPGLIG